ncbi:MAG: DUF29 family protein [Crocosphaera sp.]|nr:DUF29 family protein [Crocosphaera sp.]
MNNLYDEDYNLWSDKQIAALKNRDIEALDWDNLAANLDYPKGCEVKFPDTCPFTFEQILEEGWYPN